MVFAETLLSFLLDPNICGSCLRTLTTTYIREHNYFASIASAASMQHLRDCTQTRLGICYVPLQFVLFPDPPAACFTVLAGP